MKKLLRPPPIALSGSTIAVAAASRGDIACLSPLLISSLLGEARGREEATGDEKGGGGWRDGNGKQSGIRYVRNPNPSQQRETLRRRSGSVPVTVGYRVYRNATNAKRPRLRSGLGVGSPSQTHDNTLFSLIPFPEPSPISSPRPPTPPHSLFLPPHLSLSISLSRVSSPPPKGIQFPLLQFSAAESDRLARVASSLPVVLVLRAG
ncbi:nuclear factor related to kappa-B-binding protein, related [Musa troglodytarum]|uniref:Nuclear factor related to kappa-B-binding protein, related n=1 Tax=Musa troglodytarum TaxID=320322 RepID=A0A9E7JN93_9LILI|nr:nuclear factor related to kappa-B-binding protein, related [Musa troglodytarum]